MSLTDEKDTGKTILFWGVCSVTFFTFTFSFGQHLIAGEVSPIDWFHNFGRACSVSTWILLARWWYMIDKWKRIADNWKVAFEQEKAFNEKAFANTAMTPLAMWLESFIKDTPIEAYRIVMGKTRDEPPISITIGSHDKMIEVDATLFQLNPLEAFNKAAAEWMQKYGT